MSNDAINLMKGRSLKCRQHLQLRFFCAASIRLLDKIFDSYIIFNNARVFLC